MLNALAAAVVFGLVALFVGGAILTLILQLAENRRAKRKMREEEERYGGVRLGLGDDDLDDDPRLL